MNVMGPPGKSGVAAHGLTMLSRIVLTARMWQSARLLGAGNADITPMHLTVWALILASTTVVVGLADLLALARELNCAVVDVT